MEQLLNIKELANVLGLAPTTIIDLVRDGEIPASRVRGGRVSRHEVTQTTTALRFHPEDVRDYIRSTAVN